MQMEYRGCVVNLLDTPGHEDFSEDTYRVLTAVDAALMVIDAAKGIEPRTLKLLEVCRSRNTPVATFVNKLDRDVRPPLELLDEIESVLHMAAAPFTWPIGAGREFRGVFDFRHDCIRLFQAGSDRLTRDVRKIGMRDPACPELLGEPYAPALAEAELVRDAGSAFDRAAFLAGRQTPVFFGSAVNNFGVQEVLDALVDFAPPPGPRVAAQRSVAPDEPACSGVVFKIQANMDPAHRDRVAFVRLSSGRFVRGMRLVNCRTGRELRTSNAVSFLSQRRDIVDEAYAGDIIGIPNHGTIALGDTLTEGEVLQFGGLPFFAPELFRRAELATPMKAKQLHTGLRQLSEEGAIQIYYPEAGGAPILGAVGALQFDARVRRRCALAARAARTGPLAERRGRRRNAALHGRLPGPHRARRLGRACLPCRQPRGTGSGRGALAANRFPHAARDHQRRGTRTGRFKPSLARPPGRTRPFRPARSSRSGSCPGTAGGSPRRNRTPAPA